MNPLTKRLRRFLNQDVARRNAAAATSQVLRERQQRAEVDVYLAQVDRSARAAAAGAVEPAAGSRAPL
jgi:hypothetical protein